jgi:hypothetical protein
LCFHLSVLYSWQRRYLLSPLCIKNLVWACEKKEIWKDSLVSEFCSVMQPLSSNHEWYVWWPSVLRWWFKARYM